jgi:hypothetical protein
MGRQHSETHQTLFEKGGDGGWGYIGGVNLFKVHCNINGGFKNKMLKEAS